jgi:hypothetical protein
MTRSLYYICADVIKNIKLHGVSPKSAIYNKKNDLTLKSVLKITLCILSEYELLQKIHGWLAGKIEHSIENEYLLYVLLHEYIIMGNKLKMGGKISRYLPKNLKKFPPKSHKGPRRDHKSQLCR